MKCSTLGVTRCVTSSLEYDGEERLLVIGPAPDGRLLELVLPLDEPQRIIHAATLRPKFYIYLGGKP